MFSTRFYMWKKLNQETELLVIFHP